MLRDGRPYIVSTRADNSGRTVAEAEHRKNELHVNCFCALGSRTMTTLIRNTLVRVTLNLSVLEGRRIVFIKR